jgi:hypothetical protein
VAQFVIRIVRKLRTCDPLRTNDMARTLSKQANPKPEAIPLSPSSHECREHKGIITVITQKINPIQISPEAIQYEVYE